MNKDEAIQQLLESCNELMELVTSLKDENSFLTDTIVNSNLGKIAKERRALQLKMTQIELAANENISAANSIKEDYEQKFWKINSILDDVEAKRNNINAYINKEADKKIAKLQAEYHDLMIDNEKILNKHKLENDKILQQQLRQYRAKNKIYTIVVILSMLFSIICLIMTFI